MFLENMEEEKAGVSADRSVAGGAQIAQRDLLAVHKNLRSLIEQDLDWFFPNNSQRKAIEHRVDVADGTAKDGAFPSG